MSSQSSCLSRIVVEISVGDDRMAASDDPFFVRVEGAHGREFRLAFAPARMGKRTKPLRRGASDRFVFAGPRDADTNVAHPELNDPGFPEIELDSVTGVSLVKRMDPVPNVRGVAEMDDRLEVASCRVELASPNGETRLYSRSQSFWLGLVCGMVAQLGPEDRG